MRDEEEGLLILANLDHHPLLGQMSLPARGRRCIVIMRCGGEGCIVRFDWLLKPARPSLLRALGAFRRDDGGNGMCGQGSSCEDFVFGAGQERGFWRDEPDARIRVRL